MSQGQLGVVVSWRVPKSISFPVLRGAMVMAGISEDLMGELHPRHAMSRALRDMSDGRVIRRLQKVSEDIVTFQITREEISTVDVHYSTEAQVTLDKTTCTISSDDSHIADVARKLFQEHIDKRMTNDLTRLVQRVFKTAKADLIPIRDDGYCYFVPDHQSGLVDKIKILLSQIGGKLRQFAVRLGSDDTADSVADSLMDYMIDLVAEFKGSCEGVTAESRKDVRERRLDRATELREKLGNLGSLLGGLSENIKIQLDEAEEALLKALVLQSDSNAEVEEEALAAAV